MHHAKRIGFAIAMTASLLAGCAKPKPPPPPVPISGKVVFANGKPVAGLVIFLHPLEPQNASTSPNGALDKDGKYSLSAIPGRYKVTLLPIPGQASSAGGPDSALPAKGETKKAPDPMTRYRDATASPLELIVPPNGGELDKLTVN
jgi:hypothetical protein